MTQSSNTAPKSAVACTDCGGTTWHPTMRCEACRAGEAPKGTDSTIVKAMAAKRAATNRFLAADAEVEVEDADQISIEFTDDNPSRVATVLLSSYGAANLLDQLANLAGYDLVRKTS